MNIEDVFLAPRCAGKTTLLLQKVREAIDNGQQVIVLSVQPGYIIECLDMAGYQRNAYEACGIGQLRSGAPSLQKERLVLHR